jgi:ABC-type Fe3+ transport system substrate-binding protein
MRTKLTTLKIVFIAAILFLVFIPVAESQVTPIKIAYATTSGIRLPLWIAEEAKLYEKYKLDAKLINIPSGNTAISALVSSEVDIVSGSGSASIVAAGRGLPVVIVGSFGSTTYKLVANPGVTDLRGKVVGTSRIGATTDFALREGFTDKEGFVNGIYAQPRVFLYNTRMIARDKAPQSFDDLLDPRWKDKLGMDTTDYDWLASLIDYYGRAKALELAGKLAKQQLNLRRGPTLLAQLAVAGEFPVVVDAFPEEIMQMKNAKAPAEFVFTEPFVAVKTPTTVSIASGAPHPHAAALFVDFLLSKPGQDLMAGQGRWVSRKDGSYFADLKGKKMQIPSLEWDDKQVELIKVYTSIFSLG